MRGVVGNEGLQGRAAVGGDRPQHVEAGDDGLHVAGFEVLGHPPRPVLPAPRPLAKLQPRIGPRVFHRVPEVEDLAAADKQRGAVPDPVRPIAHHDDHRLGPEPARLPQLRPQPSEERIRVAQTRHQHAPHHRVAARRHLDALGRAQEHAGLHFAEMSLGHRRQQGWRGAVACAPAPRRPDLHAERAAIHRDDHGGGRAVGVGRRAARIGMIRAERLGVLRGRLAQALHRAPDGHRVDPETEEGARQLRRQRIRRHTPEQAELPGEPPTRLSRLDLERLQQRPPLGPAASAAIARHRRADHAHPGQPLHGATIVARHRLTAADRTRARRLRAGHGVQRGLHRRAHPRAKLVPHVALELDKPGGVVGQPRVHGQVGGRLAWDRRSRHGLC
jgi:hypothetical protein